MVRVINILQEHEILLGFLYPTYTIMTTGMATRQFITHKDVNSKYELESLKCSYTDCIIISTRIFEEFWDKDRLKEEAVKFAQKTFKSRRKKLETGEDTFIEDIKKFIFLDSEEDELESDIMELFNSFGSQSFVKTFLKLSEKISTPVTIASMNTFIAKLMNEDTSSIFYKKKQMAYRDKVLANYINAYDALKNRVPDSTGLSYIKYVLDLTM